MFESNFSSENRPHENIGASKKRIVSIIADENTARNPPRKPDNLLAKSHEDPRNPTEHRASTDSSSTSRAMPQCSRGKEKRITAHKSFVKLLTQKRAGSGVIARESCGRDSLETHDGPKHPELVQHQTQSIVIESNIVAGAVCRPSPPFDVPDDLLKEALGAKSSKFTRRKLFDSGTM
ncbi:hypothetical protein FGLOB1_10683 [Fusarium globosum]|uniref:Uncharacterized protein n=1 Tax=Fusarium globosum TaxID=78864 RepID=A0A8H5XWF5_9HYPO|nr:hypothetical protein FGLOB1_10683 [Fusarium globosum]